MSASPSPSSAAAAAAATPPSPESSAVPSLQEIADNFFVGLFRRHIVHCTPADRTALKSVLQHESPWIPLGFMQHLGTREILHFEKSTLAPTHWRGASLSTIMSTDEKDPLYGNSGLFRTSEGIQFWTNRITALTEKNKFAKALTLIKYLAQKTILDLPTQLELTQAIELACDQLIESFTEEAKPILKKALLCHSTNPEDVLETVFVCRREAVTQYGSAIHSSTLEEILGTQDLSSILTELANVAFSEPASSASAAAAAAASSYSPQQLAAWTLIERLIFLEKRYCTKSLFSTSCSSSFTELAQNAFKANPNNTALSLIHNYPSIRASVPKLLACMSAFQILSELEDLYPEKTVVPGGKTIYLDGGFPENDPRSFRFYLNPSQEYAPEHHIHILRLLLRNLRKIRIYNHFDQVELAKELTDVIKKVLADPNLIEIIYSGDISAISGLNVALSELDDFYRDDDQITLADHFETVNPAIIFTLNAAIANAAPCAKESALLLTCLSPLIDEATATTLIRKWDKSKTYSSGVKLCYQIWLIREFIAQHDFDNPTLILALKRLVHLYSQPFNKYLPNRDYAHTNQIFFLFIELIKSGKLTRLIADAIDIFSIITLALESDETYSRESSLRLLNTLIEQGLYTRDEVPRHTDSAAEDFAYDTAIAHGAVSKSKYKERWASPQPSLLDRLRRAFWG